MEPSCAQVHARLFSRLADFPELRRWLPDGVPEDLLPLLQTGRHLEQYTNREKLPTLSRHAVWKADLDGRTVALKKCVGVVFSLCNFATS